MLMMSLVIDGSERAPMATVDAILRSLNLTSVVSIGAPTLHTVNCYITQTLQLTKRAHHSSYVASAAETQEGGVRLNHVHPEDNCACTSKIELYRTRRMNQMWYSG